MKITLVNTNDRGGAANACIRLCKGLEEIGISSSLLLKQISTNKSGFYQFMPRSEPKTLNQKISLKTKRTFKELFKVLKWKKTGRELFLEQRSDDLELFSYPNSNYDITSSEIYQDADIINLHWVASFLDYASFFAKNRKPVVWTLHDMNPFTGGEHYEEWYTGMGLDGKPVKRILTDIESIEFTKIIKEKEKIFKNVRNLHIVSLCNWMTREVKRSSIFRSFPVTEIPNGIDKSVFDIRDKYHSRDLLGIPLDKKVVLFVADYITNNRKGFIYLKNAIEQIDDDDVILCSVGKKSFNVEISQNQLDLGSIADERFMSSVYSAADVFVIPSLMDNLPNTIIESLMCGTPVIGFPVGGITDMVIDGVNGYLAGDISVSLLKETIEKFLLNPLVFNRKQIRNDAVAKYALEVQASAYKELFENILEKGKKH